ncbi:MAG: hypothetical protein JOZ12_06035 [Sinobacteraceae bacterium]|nr:hypothetical protein [Nevskiaceae bacterium]
MLVVRDAAGVKIAILFNERERVARPILALGLDHIQVPQKQDWFGGLRLAVQHGYQPTLLRVLRDRKQRQVLIAVTGRFQMRGHALGGECAAARGKRGVGLDQLLIEGQE